MAEIQRYRFDPNAMPEDQVGGYVDHAEHLADKKAALKAQAEGHTAEMLREEEKWAQRLEREQPKQAAELAAKIDPLLGTIVTQQDSIVALRADLAALRGEGEPAIKALFHYAHERLIGEPCMIHRAFAPSLQRVVQIAIDCDVKLWITHSFRPLNAKLVGAIVEQAERSNHHAGSAIDMNPVYQKTWYTSGLMANMELLPQPVRSFLNTVGSDRDLRWGGAFGVNKDRVHIDSNLVLRDPAEWQRRVEQLRGEAR